MYPQVRTTGRHLYGGPRHDYRPDHDGCLFAGGGPGRCYVAGGAGDQNLFALVNVQIDIVQGWLRLSGILKTEAFKRNDGFFIQNKSS